MNLVQATVGFHCESRPQAAAITVDCGQADVERWSYGELDHAIRSVAAGFRSIGVGADDRVVVALANGPDYILAFFGAIAAGAVPIPVSEQLTDHELRFLIEDSEALVVVSDCRVLGQQQVDSGQFAAWRVLEPIPYWPRDANDPAWMLYTSGTTAEPKGVLHAHRTVDGRAAMRGPAWLDLQPDDCLLHAGALNWSYTLGVGLLDCWAVGAESVVYTGPPTPTIWLDLIEKHGCTIFAAVPSVFRRLLKYGTVVSEQIASLRHAVTAGESLSPALYRQWTDTTGRELYGALGMTECSTYVSSGPAAPVRPGYVGRPQPGRRVAVLDEQGNRLGPGEVGLLAVHRSDPGLMLGYWKRPAEQAAVERGEWFVGGDRVQSDEDGYLQYLGRDNDLMNASGYRVSPIEVEQLIATCDGVNDVAVAEVAVAADTNVIAAFVVAEHADISSLQQACAEQLASYKCPRLWRVVAELPRNRNGKLRRHELKRLLNDD